MFAGKNILLIGPGKNIVLQKDKVEKYIAEKHPVKIAINYGPEIMDVDYIFLTKPNRYEQMTTALQGVDVRVIATSNMEPKNEPFDYVINREPLLEKTGKIKDNSFPDAFADSAECRCEASCLRGLRWLFCTRGSLLHLRKWNMDL